MPELVIFLSGSRDIEQSALDHFAQNIFDVQLPTILGDTYYNTDKIKFKVGNANGFDKYFQSYIKPIIKNVPDKFSIEIYKYSDYYRTHKGGAGKKVNQAIIEDANLGIILWNTKSTGTLDAIIQSQERDHPIHLIIGIYTKTPGISHEKLAIHDKDKHELTIHSTMSSNNWFRSIMTIPMRSFEWYKF